MKTEHILIMRFSAMGDVAMMVPVVYSLAKQYPHVRITVLSRPFARPFFDGLADNVGFMASDLKKEYRGIKGLNTLYRRLVAKHFTVVADFHDVIRTKFLRMRFGLNRQHVAHINKHRQGKRRLCAKSNKVLVQQPTSFDNYAEVLAKLGYPVKLEFSSIFPKSGGDLSILNGNDAKSDNPILSPKGSDEQWIGIAPFAAHAGKVYPLEKMEQVIRLIEERYPKCRIFLFGGGEKEVEKFHEWTSIFNKCTCVCDIIKGISSELILMSHLDVMLSMDSSNMHLASLTGIPVVSIWGATHPYAGFMGWNQKAENAVSTQLPCRPCSIYGNKPCHRGDFACMNSITPEMIMKKTVRVLDKKITR